MYFRFVLPLDLAMSISGRSSCTDSALFFLVERARVARMVIIMHLWGMRCLRGYEGFWRLYNVFFSGKSVLEEN